MQSTATHLSLHDLRDKVHLAHLWPLEGAKAHLWAYRPYLNVLNPLDTGEGVRRRSQTGHVGGGTGTDNMTTTMERHLRPFFLDPPPTCPYRPLISYKIGQMPTVTRGG